MENKCKCKKPVEVDFHHDWDDIYSVHCFIPDNRRISIIESPNGIVYLNCPNCQSDFGKFDRHMVSDITWEYHNKEITEDVENMLAANLAKAKKKKGKKKVVSKWIKYAKRQPSTDKNSELYITCLQNGTVLPLMYVGCIDNINDRWMRLHGKYSFKDNPVIYWMPLPKSII